MTEIFIYLAILILGIFLIVKRPLANKTGLSIYWEISLGAVAVLVFSLYIISSYITPPMIEQDLAKQTCGSDTPQGRCYSLERKACETLWEKVAEDCRQQMADLMKARPTGLTGPALNRCKARRLDKIIHFNRAQTDSHYCKEYFKYIETP